MSDLTTIPLAPREVPSLSVRSPTTVRPLLRRVGGPLVLYHALILAGAYLLVLGFTSSSPVYEMAGVALVVWGIVTEGVILVWSASLTRRAATPAPTPGEVGAASAAQLGNRPSRLCVRCGQTSAGESSTCPRCGGPAVRVPRAQEEL